MLPGMHPVLAQISAPLKFITMTAGAYSGINIGYSAGGYPPAIGSISEQPVEGETLLQLIYDTSSERMEIRFGGDILAWLGSKTLYIDNSSYPFSSAGLFRVNGGNTEAFWYSGSGHTFVNGGTYQVAIG